jgi:hypothetical protein
MRLGEFVAGMQYGMIFTEQGSPLLSLMPILMPIEGESRRSQQGCDRVWGLHAPKRAHDLEKEHPKKLEKERAPRAPRPVLLPVQEHLLIRSKSKSGFKAVCPDKGRYTATCTTAPCHKNYLGSFGTPEEAAQAYLEHLQKEHPKELET